MEEVWRSVRGYEGLYEVSNKGRIKSLERKRPNGVGVYTQKEKILKCTKTTTGYWKIELSKNGVKKSLKIHRLVAIAFIKNEFNKPNINHIDGNPLNNNVENLEWVTQRENIIHAIATNLRTPFTITKSELKHLYIDRNLTPNEIAKRYNVSRTPIDDFIHLYGLKKQRLGEKYFITKEIILEGLKTKSQRKLAKEIGCTCSLITHYLKRIRKYGDIYVK